MSLRFAGWGGSRMTRQMASLAGAWLLVGAAGCGDPESSTPTVDRSTEAISFGPCRDCLPAGALPARGNDPAAALGRVLTPQSSSIDVVRDAGGEDWPVGVLRAEVGPEPRLAGGPVGMGPCADCLLVSTKLDDLDLEFEDIDHIDKASLELTTSRDNPWVTEDRPPWGARIVDGRVTDVWVGIPLAALKDKGLWTVAEVRLGVSLVEDGGQRDVSAPPQETRVTHRDGFFLDL